MLSKVFQRNASTLKNVLTKQNQSFNISSIARSNANQSKRFTNNNNDLLKSQSNSNKTNLGHINGLFQDVSFSKSFIHTSKSLQKIVPFKLADIGEGISEVEMLKWHVKEGDKVAEFQLLCEVRSDKANAEITSRFDGIVKKVYSKEGDIVKVGSVLVDIDSDSAGSAAPSSSHSSSSSSSTSTPTQTSSSSTTSSNQQAPDGKVLASPATRKMVAKHSIKFSDVNSSRKDGRITKQDVQGTIDNKSTSTQQQQTPIPTPTPIPQTAAPVMKAPVAEGQDRVIPLAGYARAMFKSMTAAVQVPHFGYSEELEMDQLMKLREELKPMAAQRGVKLTFMPFIIKATSQALLQYPKLNAHFDAQQMAIIQRASHNIGIAVDTPLGLVVPNIKNVQNLSIFEIAQELNRLIGGAKNGSLKVQDLTGGTLSLSNVGNVGGTYTSPVLVVPEVLIGALGAVKKLPRFDDKGQVKAAHIMCVSYSADHRCVDGVAVASFSNIVKSFIEQPQKLLLDLK